MAEFVREAQACVNDAHSTAYSGTGLGVGSLDLKTLGIEKMLELSTVQAGFRTDVAVKIMDSILEIRSNQTDQENSLLAVQGLLKMMIEQQQRTNALLEELIKTRRV